MTAHRPPVPAPASPTRWRDRLIEAGTLSLLVFTPLAYGTVEPWSEAIAELVVLGVALVWVLGMLRDWELRIELPPGWLPAYFFLALVFLQMSPLPGALIGGVSPWILALHQGAAAHLGSSSPLVPLSLAPHSTLRAGLKLGAVALLFLVCYNTCRARLQAVRAVWTMIVMGSAISIFGIVQRMTWNGRLYWLGPESGTAGAFGPFVNRAHFAGLVVVVVPMALALVVGARATRQRPARGWADRLRRFNSERGGPARLIPCLVLLMGGAALTSGSRGGVLALIAALVAMVSFGVEWRSRDGRAARIAVTSALIVLTAMWIGGDVLWGTVTRLAEEVGNPEDSARLRLWGNAVDLWKASPVIGTGLDTFGVAYPLVRTIRKPVIFTHAESDWVQLLTDTGVVGLALVAATAGMFLAALVRAWNRRRGQWNQALALAGLVILIGAVVQGLGNFNLVVMSNLIYLAVALAIALAADSRMPS